MQTAPDFFIPLLISIVNILNLEKRRTGELVALGHAVLKLGLSEYPVYALSLQELAKLMATTDVQEAITFTIFVFKV